MKPKFGEVWIADLGLVAKTRPVVIISRDDPDTPRALYIYIPLTRQNRGSKYEISLGHIPWLTNETFANVQGIGSLPLIRFEKKTGRVSKEDMTNVKRALLFACNLSS